MNLKRSPYVLSALGFFCAGLSHTPASGAVMTEPASIVAQLPTYAGSLFPSERAVLQLQAKMHKHKARPKGHPERTMAPGGFMATAAPAAPTKVKKAKGPSPRSVGEKNNPKPY
jgi:hypothetical protein